MIYYKLYKLTINPELRPQGPSNHMQFCILQLVVLWAWTYLRSSWPSCRTAQPCKSHPPQVPCASWEIDMEHAKHIIPIWFCASDKKKRKKIASPNSYQVGCGSSEKLRCPTGLPNPSEHVRFTRTTQKLRCPAPAGLGQIRRNMSDLPRTTRVSAAPPPCGGARVIWCRDEALRRRGRHD